MAGVEFAGRPVRFRGGAVGRLTVTWNVLLAVVPVLSFTVTEMLAEPVAEVVPVMDPPEEMESPEGKPEALNV